MDIFFFLPQASKLKKYPQNWKKKKKNSLLKKLTCDDEVRKQNLLSFVYKT